MKQNSVLNSHINQVASFVSFGIAIVASVGLSSLIVLDAILYANITSFGEFPLYYQILFVVYVVLICVSFVGSAVFSYKRKTYFAEILVECIVIIAGTVCGSLIFFDNQINIIKVIANCGVGLIIVGICGLVCTNLATIANRIKTNQLRKVIKLYFDNNLADDNMRQLLDYYFIVLWDGGHAAFFEQSGYNLKNKLHILEAMLPPLLKENLQQCYNQYSSNPTLSTDHYDTVVYNNYVLIDNLLVNYQLDKRI